MQRRWGAIAVGLALALCSAAPISIAQAGIIGVAPSDSDGPNQDFLTNDALWAVGVANVFDGVGQVCVVEDTSAVSSHCESDGYWGQPNAIAIVGTFPPQPIVAAPLPAGTYRVLGDNGGDGATNVLSEQFSVGQCHPGPGVDCSTDIADAQLAEWKSMALQAQIGPGVACLATIAYTLKGAPVAGAMSFAKAGGGNREYLLSLVQTGQTELKFRSPDDSLSEAISLLQKVSCGAYLMYSDIVADPPDPDFRHITDPQPETLPVTSLAHADMAVNALETARAEGEAERVGVERYTGAKAGSDPAWAAFHARRLGVAGLRMQRAMRRSVAELRSFATELDGESDVQAGSAQDLQKVRAIRDRIRVSGFVPGELSSLQGLGLDAGQIADVRAQLSEPLPAGAGGTSPAAGLRAEADALEHTACGTPASLCGFDEFARLASAVGADTNVVPAVSAGDTQMTEGDRGVNHLHLKVKLSHPSEDYVYGHLVLADPDAHPGVTIEPSFYFPAGKTTAIVRVLVPGDTVPEPDETLSLNMTLESGGTAQAQPVTITVHDNDSGPKPRPGAHGLLAFTGPGPPSTYVAEPDGTNIVRVFDDNEIQRLVVSDWSKDGDLFLMHRVPRTLDDGTGPGAPYFSLHVTNDGHTTGGAPTQLTPAGEWHVGARFSPDRRRLVSALLGSPWWKLVVHHLDAAGSPDGQPHVLGEDPQFAGWEVEFSADWSPDGSRLVFDGCIAHFATCGIYSVPVNATGAATGPPTPVVTHDADRFFGGDGIADESFGAPSWSPDGRFISLIHTLDQNSGNASSRLERLPVNAAGAPTGPSVVLSATEPVGGFYEASPDWAPDSRAIAFTAKIHPLTGENDPVDLVLQLDANGLPEGQPAPAAPTLLTPHGWGGEPPVWGPPSPVPPVVDPPAVPPPAGLPPAGAVAGSTLKSPVPAPPIGATSAASLPSNKSCISRRSFKIRLARPAGDPLAKAEVRVNGRKVQVVKKSRLTAPVDLRGLPKGKVKVSITAITRSGRRLTASRTYKTCAVRKRR